MNYFFIKQNIVTDICHEYLYSSLLTVNESTLKMTMTTVRPQIQMCMKYILTTRGAGCSLILYTHKRIRIKGIEELKIIVSLSAY